MKWFASWEWIKEISCTLQHIVLQRAIWTMLQLPLQSTLALIVQSSHQTELVCGLLHSRHLFHFAAIVCSRVMSLAAGFVVGTFLGLAAVSDFCLFWKRLHGNKLRLCGSFMLRLGFTPWALPVCTRMEEVQPPWPALPSFQDGQLRNSVWWQAYSLWCVEWHGVRHEHHFKRRKLESHCFNGSSSWWRRGALISNCYNHLLHLLLLITMHASSNNQART